MNRDNEQFDYLSQGFDRYLQRTINTAGQGRRILNFDQMQVSGSLGDVIKIGNINLDGRTGRISIQDGAGNEIVRLGKTDD